jgi:AcrR family transcriptional regulator
MPTPERTTLTDIVRAGRELLESDGLSGLTMQAVAERVGVRAPSLYKRVNSRDELIALVANAVVDDLGTRLGAVAGGSDPYRDLAELAREFRSFAQAHPAGYRLMFASTAPATDALARAVAPVMRVVTEIAGPDEALEGARLFTAWANGFLSMELSGAFHLGGDLDRAYEFGIERLARALRPAGRSRRRA